MINYSNRNGELIEMLFDIQKAVHKQEQLKYDAIHGLPDKDRDYQEPIQHIDGNVFEQQAEREGGQISKSFKNRSPDFGLRLKRQYKVDGDMFPTGQKHRAVGRNW